MLGLDRESNGWRAYALELWVESRERVADELCARADCFARLGFVEEAERDRYVAGRCGIEPISIEQRQRSFGSAEGGELRQQKKYYCRLRCLYVIVTFRTRKPAMTSHRFGIGEGVTYSEKRFPTGVWIAELIVAEQLTRDGEPEYRLLDPGRHALRRHRPQKSDDLRQHRNPMWLAPTRLLRKPERITQIGRARAGPQFQP